MSNQVKVDVEVEFNSSVFKFSSTNFRGSDTDEPNPTHYNIRPLDEFGKFDNNAKKLYYAPVLPSKFVPAPALPWKAKTIQASSSEEDSSVSTVASRRVVTSSAAVVTLEKNIANNNTVSTANSVATSANLSRLISGDASKSPVSSSIAATSIVGKRKSPPVSSKKDIVSAAAAAISALSFVASPLSTNSGILFGDNSPLQASAFSSASSSAQKPSNRVTVTHQEESSRFLESSQQQKIDATDSDTQGETDDDDSVSKAVQRLTEVLPDITIVQFKDKLVEILVTRMTCKKNLEAVTGNFYHSAKRMKIDTTTVDMFELMNSVREMYTEQYEVPNEFNKGVVTIKKANGKTMSQGDYTINRNIVREICVEVNTMCEDIVKYWISLQKISENKCSVGSAVFNKHAIARIAKVFDNVLTPGGCNFESSIKGQDDDTMRLMEQVLRQQSQKCVKLPVSLDAARALIATKMKKVADAAAAAATTAAAATAATPVATPAAATAATPVATPAAATTATSVATQAATTTTTPTVTTTAVTAATPAATPVATPTVMPAATPAVVAPKVGDGTTVTMDVDDT